MFPNEFYGFFLRTRTRESNLIENLMEVIFNLLISFANIAIFKY